MVAMRDADKTTKGGPILLDMEFDIIMSLCDHNINRCVAIARTN